MVNEFRNVFLRFGRELLDDIRASAKGRLDDAALEERVIGIGNTTAAMMESGVEDDKIIQMLQKYWNLRLSEAKEFVVRQKRTIEE